MFFPKSSSNGIQAFSSSHRQATGRKCKLFTIYQPGQHNHHPSLFCLLSFFAKKPLQGSLCRAERGGRGKAERGRLGLRLTRNNEPERPPLPSPLSEMSERLGGGWRKQAQGSRFCSRQVLVKPGRGRSGGTKSLPFAPAFPGSPPCFEAEFPPQAEERRAPPQKRAPH